MSSARRGLGGPSALLLRLLGLFLRVRGALVSLCPKLTGWVLVSLERQICVLSERSNEPPRWPDDAAEDGHLRRHPGSMFG